MSPNKQTVMNYMDAFKVTDRDTILECLTDDVVWYIPGMFHRMGKIAFDSEIENENFVGSPNIVVNRLIEEDNVVIAEGGVTSNLKTGEKLDVLFCDVFEMENGKIKKLTSYLMNK
jgi:ketosteroid isomerase-like protein